MDVVIVGAGPVGLLLANTLGQAGLRVLIVEQLPQLIDYPRGVGMDDECLRALQAAGLVEQVLPHTTPHHIMRFLTARGRCFASIEPKTDEFGWPRRNAFIQPLIDLVLAQGLARFPDVTLRLGTSVTGLTDQGDCVRVETSGPAGAAQTITAGYVVGADGGRSFVRKALNIAFEGNTAPNRWVVMDVQNDPVGTPGVQFHCDPARPYVSIALPHGVRRFEFMLFPGEAPNDEVPPALLRQILARLVDDPDRVELIRARVYTHNGRLAAQFRRGRVLLAGDAAHIMPVWQGQGYNSGIRDAANLGWKLALVAQGIAGEALLDSYEAERREHARAMIALSETAGRIFSPTNRLVAGLRDAFTLVMNAVPPVKRYVLDMRFKPMPRYKLGALYYGGGFKPASPVGRMFIQPMVETDTGAAIRLDDVIGSGFAVLAWGVNPAAFLSDQARGIVAKLNARLFCAVPSTQRAYEAARYEGVTVIGDPSFRLKTWFERHAGAVVVLRPDRFVAAACAPIALSTHLEGLAAALSV